MKKAIDDMDDIKKGVNDHEARSGGDIKPIMEYKGIGDMKVMSDKAYTEWKDKMLNNMLYEMVHKMVYTSVQNVNKSCTNTT